MSALTVPKRTVSEASLSRCQSLHQQLPRCHFPRRRSLDAFKDHASAISADARKWLQLPRCTKHRAACRDALVYRLWARSSSSLRENKAPSRNRCPPSGRLPLTIRARGETLHLMPSPLDSGLEGFVEISGFQEFRQLGIPAALHGPDGPPLDESYRPNGLRRSGKVDNELASVVAERRD